MAEAIAQVRCGYCTKMADADKVPGEGDIICVQCGLNLLTGQQIQRPAGMKEARPERTTPVWLFAALPALLLAVAGAVAVIYFLTKDPVEDARRLAVEGNAVEALAVLDAHLAQQPQSVPGHLLRGKLYWQSQDFSRAADEFEAVLDREPRSEEAATLSMLAVSKLTGGQAVERQVAMYQRVLESQPGNATAQRLLALTHGAAGRFDEQVAAMDRLGEAAASDAFLLQMRGAALALLNRSSEAELTFSQAAQAGETDGLAPLGLGLLASMNNDAAKARESLEKATAGAPEVAALANTRLGLLLIAEGDFEAALARLRQAIANGGGEDAKFYHALCLRHLRLTAEATQGLNEVRDAKGRYAGAAALELAVLALEANDPDAAEENLRQATAAGETSAQAQTVQGRVYLSRGQDTEAQATFRQAIKSDPNYAPAHLENGLVFVKRGVTDEGVLELEKYLELVGDTVSGGVPEVRLLLAQLKETEGGATPEAVQ